MMHNFAWQWDDNAIAIAYETFGEGTQVLLLPAFSTVSSREEMAPLAKRLEKEFQAITVDWPGFGASPRLRLDYKPALYHAFLDAFVTQELAKPLAVIAAGHAAGYVLALSRNKPNTFTRIVLVAPTWRGPLPTVMGEHRHQAYERVRKLISLPILGEALYRLNISRPFIALMYRRHVYADANRITPMLIRAKARIAHWGNARFASAAFVTGALDSVQSRAEFLALVQTPPCPLLVVYGRDTPPRSKLEMEALVAYGIEHRLLPGALGLHEEYAEEVFKAILPFFQAG